MFSRWIKPDPDVCSHKSTVSVRSAGMERTVCETCGHLSFVFLDDVPESIDRGNFSRRTDRLVEQKMSA